MIYICAVIAKYSNNSKDLIVLMKVAFFFSCIRINLLSLDDGT